MRNIPPAKDKYFLRTLHQEIDFYDRKLSYMANHEVFASAEEREVAEKKVVAKRALLAKTAKSLAESGVEFSPTELPRSFRPQPENAAPQGA